MIDLQHRIFLRSHEGRLHHATLPAHTSTVLDIGCGTGQWACSFADAHPDASVIGADLRPPALATKPANCAFVRCDAESEWGDVDRALAGRQLDYIHARLLTLSVQAWGRFFGHAAKRLAPDGVIEVTNVCLPRGSKAGFTAKTSAFVRYQQLLLEASIRAGDDWETSRLHPPRIRNAGLELQEQAFMEWPVGAWAAKEKERAIGRLMAANALVLLDVSPVRLLKFYPDMSREEVIKLKNAAKRELEDNYAEIKYYSTLVIHIAKKPKS